MHKTNQAILQAFFDQGQTKMVAAEYLPSNDLPDVWPAQTLRRVDIPAAGP